MLQDASYLGLIVASSMLTSSVLVLDVALPLRPMGATTNLASSLVAIVGSAAEHPKPGDLKLSINWHD